MIAVVVGGLTHLKLLQPIIHALIDAGSSYAIYYASEAIPGKNYDRTTISSIDASSSAIIHRSAHAIPFKDTISLYRSIVKIGCRKIVAVELALTHPNMIELSKSSGIKSYSINYLTDSMWTGDYDKNSRMCRVFYTTEHIMNSYVKFANKPLNTDVMRSLGSPLLDQVRDIASGDCTTMLLPNINSSLANKLFGNHQNLLSIVSHVYDMSGPIIFKTREKQWLPPGIEQYSKEIVYDGDIMYPSALARTLKESKNVVLFYSSGIYEAVYSGAYVTNIMPHNMKWRWNKKHLDIYFSNCADSLYNFSGVVDSVSIHDAACGNFKLSGAVPTRRAEWVDKFIGDVSGNSATKIVADIINS